MKKRRCPLKFKLPVVNKEDFFFNQREKKLFFTVLRIGAIIVGVCVVILIVVAIAGSVGRTAPDSMVTDNPAPLELTQTGGVKKPLDIDTFIITERANRGLEPEFRPLRDKVTTWTPEMIAKYWISPEEIGLENLTKMNDKNIEEYFSDVK